MHFSSEPSRHDKLRAFLTVSLSVTFCRQRFAEIDETRGVVKANGQEYLDRAKLTLEDMEEHCYDSISLCRFAMTSRVTHSPIQDYRKIIFLAFQVAQEGKSLGPPREKMHAMATGRL